MITFARPDGASCPAYLAQPPAGPKAPGLVIIQEWWGLNDQIKATADRFAAAGFRSLVPDLYRGELAQNAGEAEHIMNALNWGDAVEQDLKGALRFLKQGGNKAGVLGFCMGGALAIIAAANLKETDAAVCFYGIPPAAAADPKNITAPILFHFATDDDWCNAEAVADLQSQLKAASIGHELYTYADTQHAFFNEERPEVYDAGAAKLAFDRSVAFIRNAL